MRLRALIDDAEIRNLTSGATPSVLSQFDYTYRHDRRIDTWKVEQGSGPKTWTFAYNEARELSAASLRDAAQTLLESNIYGYDKAGNRVEVAAGTTAPKNFETNNLNQVLSERGYGPTTFAGTVDEPATVTVNGKKAKVLSTDGGAPFKFEALVDLDGGANTVVVEAKDGQNNTATKTYSIPPTATTKKYEYDALGNLRFEKQPNGTVIREYRWDQQNRLVRELHGTSQSVYEYDGASRRVRIKELTNNVETKNETFVWCGARICQKRASNGSTIVRSYFGNGFEEGANDYFYTRDHLGSVREVVASNGTTVASRLSYDPWGKVTETGFGAKSDFTYTGHYFGRPTGLNLAKYRAYDPALGRWLSRDPLGLPGGLNLYGYVGNDPLNFFDPDGRLVAPVQHDPFSEAAAALYEASAWNFMQAGDRWDAGNYGGAAVYGYFGTSLAALGAVAQIGPEIVNVVASIEGAGGGRCPNRPPNMSPSGAGRNGAFRAAKAANGIPMTQHPNEVLPNTDLRGKPQPGRQYVFEKGGQKIIIREDSAGHDFGAGDPQNRGPHFNDPAGNHYDY